MSDIIYTPPASSGGGQNPTTNYIPLNNGTSNFVNSSIYNDLGSNFLRTEFNNAFGLSLTDDGTNSFAFLGDFNYYYNGAYIQVNDTSRFIDINAGDNQNATSLILDDTSLIIKTKSAGNDIGLKLDFASQLYYLGDFNGTNANLLVGQTYIGCLFAGSDNGIGLNFSANLYQFGDFSLINGKTYLNIVDQSKSIFLGCGDGDTTGLIYYRIIDTNPNSCYVALGDPADGLGFGYQNSDTPTNDYLFLNSNYEIDMSSGNNGFFRLTANGTNTNSFLLDPVADKMTFTTGNLNYVGASLTDGATVVPAGKNLILTINGTQYHIPLYV